MSMIIEKIYFDMDGVLADFERGVKEICKMNAPSQNDKDRSRDLDEEMWRRVREIEHFYDELEPMSGAKELFDAVYTKYGDKCEILTGIPKPKRGIVNAAEDKKRWIGRLFSKDLKVNIVFREEKPQYCTGKGCILIDDMEKNIKEWEDMGGTGIVNVSAASTMKALKKMGIL